jgi:hypothetical protein
MISIGATELLIESSKQSSRNLCARASKSWIRLRRLSAAGPASSDFALSWPLMSFFHIRLRAWRHITDPRLVDTLDVMPAMSGVCA